MQTTQIDDGVGKVEVQIKTPNGTESVEIDLWLFHDKLVTFNETHRDLLRSAFGGSGSGSGGDAKPEASAGAGGVGQEGDDSLPSASQPSASSASSPDPDAAQEAMDRYNRAHDAFFVANGFPSGLSYRSRNQISQFVFGEVARQKKDLPLPRVTSPPAA